MHNAPIDDPPLAKQRLRMTFACKECDLAITLHFPLPLVLEEHASIIERKCGWKNGLCAACCNE